MAWRRRWLLQSFVRRDFLNRYAGSVAGGAWALLNPAALLAVYAFVFAAVFRVRLPPEYGETSYLAFVAVTLWPWLMFAEGVDRAMGCITANAQLVRKVAFPHEFLVIASVATTFAVHLAGYLLVLAVLRLTGEPIRFSGLPWTLALIALLALATIGVAALLASIQAVFRDAQQVVAIVLMLLFYATPVLYPASLVPAALKPWIQANPLAWLVERVRDGMLRGAAPEPVDALIALASLATLAGGLWVFRRLSPYFEDFL